MAYLARVLHLSIREMDDMSVDELLQWLDAATSIMRAEHE